MSFPFPRPFPGPSAMVSFSVLSLFSSGEQGAWYDPSDFTTMYQDAAGTTPVTAVEQPVGLLLDKSKGLALGADALGGAGAFSSAGSWSVGAGWSIGSGVATAASAANMALASVLTIGKWYKITLEVTAFTSGTLYAGTISNLKAMPTGTGTKTAYFLADATTFYLAGLTAFNGTVDNVVVNDIAGNHASQSTAASRPVLSARVNLLTRTEEFDNATAWSRIGANPITANQTTAPNGTNTADLFTAQANGAYTSYIYQQNIALGATSCRLSIRAKKGNQKYIFIDLYSTTIDYVAVFDLDAGTYVGSAGLAAFDGTPTITPLGNGWYELVATKTVAANTYNVAVGTATGNNTIQATGDTIYIWGADLRVTNVGVNLPAYQRVGAAVSGTTNPPVTGVPDYDTSGFPLYLKFDGTDDSLATGSIDFSATSKMSVFAGVRKISDATGQILYESSASAVTNVGSFAMYAGNNAAALGAIWAAQNHGNGTSVSAEYSAPAGAPVSTVLTTQFAIQSTPRTVIRTNGSVLGTLTGSADTGNYGNYPLYIGSRAGPSFPFNGNLYSFIVRGALSTDAQIASTETYVNTKTGAY